MKKNHDIIDIAANLCHETEQAFFIDDGVKRVWIPKSQAQQNDDGTFSMPEWLAMDKGFI